MERKKETGNGKKFVISRKDGIVRVHTHCHCINICTKNLILFTGYVSSTKEGVCSQRGCYLMMHWDGQEGVPLFKVGRTKQKGTLLFLLVRRTS